MKAWTFPTVTTAVYLNVIRVPESFEHKIETTGELTVGDERR